MWCSMLRGVRGGWVLLGMNTTAVRRDYPPVIVMLWYIVVFRVLFPVLSTILSSLPLHSYSICLSDITPPSSPCHVVTHGIVCCVLFPISSTILSSLPLHSYSICPDIIQALLPNSNTVSSNGVMSWGQHSRCVCMCACASFSPPFSSICHVVTHGSVLRSLSHLIHHFLLPSHLFIPTSLPPLTVTL
jgi:hypothetical protein